jgi:hypothetical protein
MVRVQELETVLHSRVPQAHMGRGQAYINKTKQNKVCGREDAECSAVQCSAVQGDHKHRPDYPRVPPVGETQGGQRLARHKVAEGHQQSEVAEGHLRSI